MSSISVGIHTRAGHAPRIRSGGAAVGYEYVLVLTPVEPDDASEPGLFIRSADLPRWAEAFRAAIAAEQRRGAL